MTLKKITGTGGFTSGPSALDPEARLIYTPDGVCIGTVKPLPPVLGTSRPASLGYGVKRGAVDLGQASTMAQAVRLLCGKP